MMTYNALREEYMALCRWYDTTPRREAVKNENKINRLTNLKCELAKRRSGNYHAQSKHKGLIRMMVRQTLKTMNKKSRKMAWANWNKKATSDG